MPVIKFLFEKKFKSFTNVLIFYVAFVYLFVCRTFVVQLNVQISR